ncbi:MAG: PqqD family protein [Anaerolineales bacterium]|nr:PqqD family protein [Anaerolineales bacterium]
MKPQTKIDITEELVGQELFLFDQKSETVFCLNSGAALIWFLCDGTREIDDIVSEIVLLSPVPEPQIRVEVHEAITQFQTLNLLNS